MDSWTLTNGVGTLVVLAVKRPHTPQEEADVLLAYVQIAAICEDRIKTLQSKVKK